MAFYSHCYKVKGQFNDPPPLFIPLPPHPIPVAAQSSPDPTLMRTALRGSLLACRVVDGSGLAQCRCCSCNTSDYSGYAQCVAWITGSTAGNLLPGIYHESIDLITGCRNWMQNSTPCMAGTLEN